MRHSQIGTRKAGIVHSRKLVDSGQTAGRALELTSAQSVGGLVGSRKATEGTKNSRGGVLHSRVRDTGPYDGFLANLDRHQAWYPPTGLVLAALIGLGRNVRR
jgi:hypothetical protein